MSSWQTVAGAGRLWMFVGILLLLAWHEIGHVAACLRTGIRADCLGVGFYLFLPAFYTKMSLVRLLDRRDRVIVYTSGIYFQAIASIALTIGALTADQPALVDLALVNNFTIFLTLMPVLKFDGYKIWREYQAEIDAYRAASAAKLLIVSVTFAYLGFLIYTLSRNIEHAAASAWRGTFDTGFLLIGLLSIAGVSFS